MFEMFERLIARLREVWGSMTLNQKVISGGVFVALFVVFAYLSTLRENLVEYTVLFTELDAKSASEILTRLDQQNVTYRLSGDGTTIEVPRDQATQLKITLTAEGLPETGIVGFEILDTTTFGMSERIQEVQIQRALQGELSKTLMSLDAIEWANVNLSIPKPTLFMEDEEPTTAAVILKIRRGGSLSQKTIEGLSYLISSAVPGLEPRNVTILDTQGNPLTMPVEDDTMLISGTQLELKMQVDKYISNEAKRLLDGALGLGKSLVVVNSELDWDGVERYTTTYDQENSAILSEERITDSTPSPDGTGEHEESVINYENTKVIENFVNNTGDIAHLSVSVFVDWRDSTWADENGIIQIIKVPWSDERLASIRSITENAVGYKPDRGDNIEVEQIEFGAAEIPAEEARTTVSATIVEGLRALGIGIAILGMVAIFFFMLRAITTTLDPSRISLKAEKEFEKHKVELEGEEKIPESERDILVRNILKTSVANPEIVAKTLKTFFKE